MYNKVQVATNCTSLYIRHSFLRLCQAARAAVPTTYGRDIGKDRSTATSLPVCSERTCQPCAHNCRLRKCE